MTRRYYKKRRSNANLLSTLLLLGVAGIFIAYSQLGEEQVILAIISVIVLLLMFMVVVLFMKYRNDRHRLKKLRALEFVDADKMDGLVFEKYVAELLKDRGYKNVALTERYDYGVDITANKEKIRWGVQVKRYSGVVKAEAVRQVVTALKKYNCQRAMVVTNSTFSRPAKVLAESNNCVLVGKEDLAEWIIAFQSGK